MTGSKIPPAPAGDAVARRLTPLLERALAAYCAIANAVCPDNAKSVQQHHAACRAALAHVEALLKVMRLGAVMRTSSPDGEARAVDDLVTQARVELSQYDRQDRDDGELS